MLPTFTQSCFQGIVDKKFSTTEDITWTLLKRQVRNLKSELKHIQ
jgi:hypothetical protein